MHIQPCADRPAPCRALARRRASRAVGCALFRACGLLQKTEPLLHHPPACLLRFQSPRNEGMSVGLCDDSTDARQRQGLEVSLDASWRSLLKTVSLLLPGVGQAEFEKSPSTRSKPPDQVANGTRNERILGLLCFSGREAPRVCESQSPRVSTSPGKPTAPPPFSPFQSDVCPRKRLRRSRQAWARHRDGRHHALLGPPVLAGRKLSDPARLGAWRKKHSIMRKTGGW